MAYYHLKAKLAWELAENRDFFLIWGMNLPICGCTNMIEGTKTVLKVSNKLLYAYTMRNEQYISTWMMEYHHCMADASLILIFWSDLLGQKPDLGLRSMLRGTVYVLQVSITLFYTHKMRNYQCSSTYMMVYHHLMTKSHLRNGRKSWSETGNPPTRGYKKYDRGTSVDALSVHHPPICIWNEEWPIYKQQSDWTPYHCIAKCAWKLFWFCLSFNLTLKGCCRSMIKGLNTCCKCSSISYIHVQWEMIGIYAIEWCHTSSSW